MTISNCKHCKRQIRWQKEEGRNLAYDLNGTMHWQTCPSRLKVYDQKHCPACLLDHSEIIDKILEIDVDKKLCRRHEASMRIIVGNREIDLSNNALHHLKKKTIRAKKMIDKKHAELAAEGLLFGMDRFSQ